jgi:hypothetical protein
MSAMDMPPTACEGHSKKKVTDLDVVGWFLGGQKSTRVGQFFFEIFLSCFCTPLTEKRPKTRFKKIEKKSVLDFLVDFFEKLFDTICL